MGHTKYNPIGIDCVIGSSSCLWSKPRTFTDPKQLADLEPFYSEWLSVIWPRRTWFRLFNTYQHFQRCELPDNFDLYVISYHGEQIDFEWLFSLDSDKQIILVSDSNWYDTALLPSNVQYVRWLVWQHYFDRMLSWYGTGLPQKNINSKASAICHRITQSKIWITTAMLEHIPEQDRMVALGDWLIDKDVHHWHLTGNLVLDGLTNIFRQKYLGQTLRFDDFTQQDNNHQTTADPANKALQSCALHFTNESFHYSHMFIRDRETILPGPFLTEKTFKCLFAGTAFIPVGQFDTYSTLQQLGLEFNYGLDLSFDHECKNLKRFQMLVDFIQKLNTYSAHELYEITRHSTEHNAKIVRAGTFRDACDRANQKSVQNLKSLLA